MKQTDVYTCGGTEVKPHSLVRDGALEHGEVQQQPQDGGLS